MTEQQANKVMTKYLPIITERFKDDKHADVGTYIKADTGQTYKVYAYISAEQTPINLLEFCGKYGIDYDISDCM